MSNTCGSEEDVFLYIPDWVSINRVRPKEVKLSNSFTNDEYKFVHWFCFSPLLLLIRPNHHMTLQTLLEKLIDLPAP